MVDPTAGGGAPLGIRVAQRTTNSDRAEEETETRSAHPQSERGDSWSTRKTVSIHFTSFFKK
tara:strand:+ start:1849 stop:2034 length:186 start_codon:yes stop_codon:yes gene_type:complete